MSLLWARPAGSPVAGRVASRPLSFMACPRCVRIPLHSRCSLHSTPLQVLTPLHSTPGLASATMPLQVSGSQNLNTKPHKTKPHKTWSGPVFRAGGVRQADARLQVLTQSTPLRSPPLQSSPTPAEATPSRSAGPARRALTKSFGQGPSLGFSNAGGDVRKKEKQKKKKTKKQTDLWLEGCNIVMRLLEFMNVMKVHVKKKKNKKQKKQKKNPLKEKCYINLHCNCYSRLPLYH